MEMLCGASLFLFVGLTPLQEKQVFLVQFILGECAFGTVFYRVFFKEEEEYEQGI